MVCLWAKPVYRLTEPVSACQAVATVCLWAKLVYRLAEPVPVCPWLAPASRSGTGSAVTVVH